MKTILGIGVVVFMSLIPGANTHEQQTPSPPASGAASSANDTITAQLNQQLSFVETELVDAAKAMPEDKYSFPPTNGEFRGVRNFAQEVLHVATADCQIYGPIIPDDPEVAASRQAAASAQTKDRILQYLQDSFAFAHKAIGTINVKNMLQPVKRPANRYARTPLELAVFGCSHGSDVYGRLVEYLRMNGIILPATANQPARGPHGAAHRSREAVPAQPVDAKPSNQSIR